MSPTHTNAIPIAIKKAFAAATYQGSVTTVLIDADRNPVATMLPGQASSQDIGFLRHDSSAFSSTTASAPQPDKNALGRMGRYGIDN